MAMTDAELAFLQEQVGNEAYLDGMKAARKLVEKWGALSYHPNIAYQWGAGFSDALQDVALGLPITDLPDENYHDPTGLWNQPQ